MDVIDATLKTIFLLIMLILTAHIAEIAKDFSRLANNGIHITLESENHYD
jgi:hypothetical protein